MTQISQRIHSQRAIDGGVYQALSACLFEHLLEQRSVLTRLCTHCLLLLRTQVSALLCEHNHAVSMGIQIMQVSVDDSVDPIGQRGAWSFTDLPQASIGRFNCVKAHRIQCGLLGGKVVIQAGLFELKPVCNVLGPAAMKALLSENRGRGHEDLQPALREFAGGGLGLHLKFPQLN